MAEAFAALYILIREGKRSHEQILMLLRAMELARKGKLGAVVHKKHDKTLEEITAFCDTPIENSGMPRDVIDYLHTTGIRLSGELFRFWWNGGWKIGECVGQYIGENGLPFEFDPWHEGWRPKYLKDPEVIEAFNASVSTMGKPNRAWKTYPFFPLPHGGGCRIEEQWVGERMRAVRKSLEAHKELQAELKNHPKLHAAMLLPPDWKPPAEKNPERVAWEGLIARVREFRDRWGWPSDTPGPYDPKSRLPRDVYGREKLNFTPEQRERRKHLLEALHTEQFPEEFFERVVMNHGTDYGETETIRDFLLSKNFGGNNESQVRGFLAYWGLEFCATDEELKKLLEEQE